MYKERVSKSSDELEQLIEEFRNFAFSGMVGFYNSCSITSIILTSRKYGWHKNVFTIVVFEELPFRDYRRKYHTKHPVKITNDLRLSVVSQRAMVADAVRLYEDACRKGRWQQPGCPELQIAECNILSKHFVPSSSDVPLNSILKNPHRYPSYVFELFCEKKEFYKKLNPEYALGKISPAVKKLYQAVNDCIPIDLEYISDRWENIIFQFPVNLLKIEARGEKDGEHINVSLRWHPLVVNERRVVNIQLDSKHDKIILGCCNTTVSESSTRLRVGTTHGEMSIQVMSRDNNIILYQKAFHLINLIGVSLRIMNPEKVTINVPPRGKRQSAFTYTIQPVSIEHMSSGKIPEWREWVNKRSNLASKRELERRLEFVQYGVGGTQDWERALQDIHQLIKWHGENGVYLWDPFADGRDILSTVFACEINDAPLKVITSYNKFVRKIAVRNGIEICNCEDWMRHLKGFLSKAVQQRKVNLEVRCQHGCRGWKFHDRFLIFPGLEPKVWSLGCSINALGQSHSILMKVEHAQPVLDAFELLWEELDQCVIWP